MLDHRLLVNPPGGGVVAVKGSSGGVINPATEEAVRALAPTVLTQYTYSQVVTPTSFEIIFDSGAGKYVEIQDLMFETDSHNTRLRFRYYDAGGALIDLRWLAASGTGTYGAANLSYLEPQTIQAVGLGIFQTLEYDTNKYRFAFRRPMVFPNGVRVDISAPSGTTNSASVAILALE